MPSDGAEYYGFEDWSEEEIDAFNIAYDNFNSMCIQWAPYMRPGCNQPSCLMSQLTVECIDTQRKVWDDVLTKNVTFPPERSPAMKKLIRKGIPQELRGQLWLYYSGATELIQGMLDPAPPAARS